MATDPSHIALSPTQQRMLAELADRTGLAWDEVFAAAIGGYRGPCEASTDARCRSFFDAMKDVVGIVRDAPPDLSCNPKHMQGFGRDRTSDSD